MTTSLGRARRDGRQRRLFFALACALSLAGCASAPRDQIRQFSQAFTSVDMVGQPLLDDLAIAERTEGREIALRRARGVSSAGPAECQSSAMPWRAAPPTAGTIDGFCLQDAAYFSDLADPPATRQFRGGLNVIQRYADVLSTLAEGGNVDAALGEVDALGSEVSGLLGVVSVSTGLLAPALTALQPILRDVAQQSNAAEAKRLILLGAPEISRLIAALQAAAPAAFRVLAEAPLARATRGEQPAAEIARIETYRVAVANYVILLGKLQGAWDLTVAAATAPTGSPRLSSLVERAAELRADAEAARRTFSILRAGVAAQ